MQARDPVDGGGGVAGDLPKAGHIYAPSGSSDLPLPIVRGHRDGPRSGVEY